MVWSLWLPISIEIAFAFVDVSYGIYDGRPMERFISSLLYFYPLMWVLGMPLTIAVQLIHRHSRILAYVIAAICVPISLFAFYLSVPLPSFLNSLFGAALAWLVVLILYLAMLLRWILQRTIMTL